MSRQEVFRSLTCTVRNSKRAAEALVADRVAQQVRDNPRSILGLATGNSMLAVYRELARLHVSEGLSLSNVTTFNLDEYCDLPPAHPASFAEYMRRELIERVDIRPTEVHIPACESSAIASFESAIARRGIDLQLLGIGRNGHIGFNEPGSDRDSRTRVVALAEDTRAANQCDFPEGFDVPTHAVTMGLATILSARRILLLATGPTKARALADALNGPITPQNPASFLRLHPNVEFVCDIQAAEHLDDTKGTLNV